MVLLGYNSNGFVHHRLEEGLELLAEAGCRAVALTPDVGHLDPREAGAAEVEAVGRRCAELGLTVVLETGARFLLDPRRKHRPNLLEVDAAAREPRLAFLETMLDWCPLLGSRVLSFWSGVLPEGQDQAGAAAALQGALERLAPRAEAHGVHLALEPEPGHWIETVGDWRAFREARAPFLRLTLDTGHLVANGEPPAHELLPGLGEDLVNLQLDDAPPGEHRHLPPGEGAVDWPALARALRAFPGLPACFELSRDSHAFPERLHRAVAFWRGLEGNR